MGVLGGMERVKGGGRVVAGWGGEGGRVVMVMGSSLCWVAKATSGVHLIQQPLKPQRRPRHMTVVRPLHMLHTQTCAPTHLPKKKNHNSTYERLSAR